MDIVNLVILFLLIAFTAFFVAVEFAIIRVRSTRIDQLIAEGKKGAVSAKKVTSQLDEYLSACQLGITVTALGLGWIGEPTVENLLKPLFDYFNLGESITHILSFAIAFGSVTFLHVVVGELAPKTIAIQQAERVTLLFSKPIMLFYKIMYPFIWALNGSARFVTGLLGFKPASEHEIAHSEEELRMILSESYKNGEINQTELKYMNNIFEFDNKIAKEIMIPRTEIISLSMDDNISDVLDLYKEENYTRFPVTNNGNKDDILGVVNIKDLLSTKLSNPDKELTVKSIMMPVIRVVDTVAIHALLAKMQKERNHMAILIDEYGGTSGLVTIEDIIEVIVGEIRDELDTDEISEIRKIKEDHYILDGKVLISEVNQLLNISISDEEVDTIGGWFLTKEFEAEVGTEIEEQGFIFRLKDIDSLHIKYIEVEKVVETKNKEIVE
ncbi:hypothetical protein CVD28_03985 [Bacillus sp. M6-12]|uniref:hemolysin family protein n=1 Tax=Bacillus sp. M6-12 TaxID=2054166 RepID=UPI000C778351|nr:hemolysin family protein [Bacillus sp. M6-12]PLS19586.1 hypothetical protein CVD28_03985 [Bacillus sp. M6-12]